MLLKFSSKTDANTELELISLKNCLQLLSQPLLAPAEKPLKMKHLLLTTIAAVVLLRCGTNH